MAKLTCLNSASKWELEQVSKYPEMKLFVDKLKNIVEKHPEKGLSDSFLSVNGKTVPCFKHTVNLLLFPHEYALGYDFISALYVFNNKEILIIKFYFS